MLNQHGVRSCLVFCLISIREGVVEKLSWEIKKVCEYVKVPWLARKEFQSIYNLVMHFQ